MIKNPKKCEVRSVIRFLNAKCVPPIKIYRQITEVYGDVMSERSVRKWCVMFNSGRLNVHDNERSGRPSVVTEELKARIEAKILENKLSSINELHSFFPEISRTVLYEFVSDLEISEKTTIIKQECLNNEIDIEEFNLKLVKNEPNSTDMIIGNKAISDSEVKEDIGAFEIDEVENMNVPKDINFIKCETHSIFDGDIDGVDPLTLTGDQDLNIKPESASDISDWSSDSYITDKKIFNSSVNSECLNSQEGAFQNKSKEGNDSTNTINQDLSTFVLNEDINYSNSSVDDNIVEEQHGSQAQYMCSECSYSTPNESILKFHLRTHSSENSNTSSTCVNSTTQISNLNVQDVTQTGGKLFKCLQCNYSTVIQVNMKYHTCDNVYKCHQCDYSAVKKSNLNLHLRTHTGKKPYKCTQCEYSTVQKANLNRHLLTHAGEKRFKCTQCNYSAIHKSYLRQHLVNHTGEKPFKCCHCNYSSGQKSHLNRHLLTHTGEKPFKCTKCIYSASRKAHLNQHVLNHHKNNV